MRNILCLLLASAFLLPGCDKVDDRGKNTGKRTIFCYMAGDNNDLSDETTAKIKAMCEGFGGQGKLLIYRDYDSRTGLISSATLSSVELTTDGTYKDVVLKRYGSENSASADVVARSIRDAVDWAPAESYGLIVFSRGSGWLPTDQTELSESYDDGNDDDNDIRPYTSTGTAGSIIQDRHNMLSMTDFAAAIPAGLFDFIVLEANHMGDIETLYELSDKTERLLTSVTEICSPGFTGIYPDALKHLYEESPDLEAFAKAYMEHWRKEPVYPFATISLYDCTKTQALVDALKAPLAREIDNMHLYIEGVQRFGRKDKNSDLDYSMCFLDLCDYVKRFATEKEMTEIQKALDKVIVYKDHTKSFGLKKEDGFDINTYCGVSIYPEPENYIVINNTHRHGTRFGRYVWVVN